MVALQYKFTSDILFKMFFTRHEELLCSLVAAALGKTPEDIKTLEIKNPEILPEEIGGKFCRLDLNMVINDEIVDLEIQVGNEGNFKERALYYWSRLFSASLGEGKDYALTPRTILIGILDFNLFDCAEIMSEFAAMEKTRHEILTDRMCILFYELNKLPDLIDINDKMLVWLKLISVKTEEDLAEIERMEVEEMAQAVNAYKQITKMPDYQELERIRSKARHDEAQALSNARKQGQIEGQQQGLQQGMQQGQRKANEETAKMLLALGDPVDKISAVTNLSHEEIEALK